MFRVGYELYDKQKILCTNTNFWEGGNINTRERGLKSHNWLKISAQIRRQGQECVDGTVIPDKVRLRKEDPPVTSRNSEVHFVVFVILFCHSPLMVCTETQIVTVRRSNLSVTRMIYRLRENFRTCG